jgi:hypothetical protein
MKATINVCHPNLQAGIVEHAIYASWMVISHLVHWETVESPVKTTRSITLGALHAVLHFAQREIAGWSIKQHSRVKRIQLAKESLLFDELQVGYNKGKCLLHEHFFLFPDNNNASNNNCMCNDDHKCILMIVSTFLPTSPKRRPLLGRLFWDHLDFMIKLGFNIAISLVNSKHVLLDTFSELRAFNRSYKHMGSCQMMENEDKMRL